MPNSAFVEVLRSLWGGKADGFSGGCDKVVLPVEVVPEKGEVVLGCFVKILTLGERRVAGGEFRCNLVKNWSVEKMCLVGMQVDCSLDVSVFSRGYSRRRHLTHENPKTPRHHRRRPWV